MFNGEDDEPEVIVEKRPEDIHLPPYWSKTENFAKLWFSNAEMEYAMAGITSEQAKYDRTILEFEDNILEFIEGSVDPESETPYTDMKKYLIWKAKAERRRNSIPSPEEEERRNVIRKLRTKAMGRRSPGGFLRYLGRNGGDLLPEHVLRAIWAYQLPKKIQVAIANLDLPLEELAHHADRLHKVFNVECRCCHSMATRVRCLNYEVEEVRQRLQRYKELELRADSSPSPSTSKNGKLHFLSLL